MSYDPEDPENDEEPLTPEEEAERDAQYRQFEIAFEEKARATFGPPDVRRQKNHRYASRLVRRYGEETLRGLLLALSRLQRPLCAHWLSEVELSKTPLSEIIQPFELGGLRFVVLSVNGPEYTVDIEAGFGRAGDGGRFVVARDGPTFRVTDTLSERIF